jgi:hypothetical protein
MHLLFFTFQVLSLIRNGSLIEVLVSRQPIYQPHFGEFFNFLDTSFLPLLYDEPFAVHQTEYICVQWR